MKTIKTFLSTLFLCFCLNATAQTNIWIMGYIYAEENGNQITVPFATISIFDYSQQDEMKYFTVSGIYGNYSIKPYDHKKQYHIVVEAPGYKTRSFNLKEIPEVWNGKPFSGNCNLNILMEKDNGQSTTTSIAKVYKKEELKKVAEAKTLSELLLTIPEIKKEGNDYITTNGNSVCLFINGSNAPTSILHMLGELEISDIASIEYYQLPDDATYGAILNVIMNAGQQAASPNRILKQSSLIF